LNTDEEEIGAESHFIREGERVKVGCQMAEIRIGRRGEKLWENCNATLFLPTPMKPPMNESNVFMTIDFSLPCLT